MQFFLTFGQDHPLKDCWVEVAASSSSEARAKVFRIFGDKWAFLYSIEYFEPEYYPSGKVGRTLA
uniref:Uncharacterized protein n=1 Tax=viral metagenome TaxID=1070528 RepID=A0A6H1ZIR9_9ZZZZ